eukprot:jgi/Chlat1/5011/Chrsp32S04983
MPGSAYVLCLLSTHPLCALCVLYALAWGEHIVAAGNDCKVVFYDRDGTVFQHLDYTTTSDSIHDSIRSLPPALWSRSVPGAARSCSRGSRGASVGWELVPWPNNSGGRERFFFDTPGAIMVHNAWELAVISMGEMRLWRDAERNMSHPSC